MISDVRCKSCKFFVFDNKGVCTKISIHRRENDHVCKKYKDRIVDLSKVNICHNMNTDYDSVDQFVCSECGIELQDWNRVEREDDGEIIYHEYHLRYCPNCGRKIEDE